MITNKSKGFTIIELLVVVAIIAVLASIVLINVNAIRNKAADAKTEAQMAALRPAAATYYDSNANNYGANTTAGADCATSAAGSMAFDSASGFKALIALGSYSDNLAPLCGTDATATTTGFATKWSACKQLKADTTKYFCVDSTGSGKVITGTCATAIVAAGIPC